MTARDQQQKDSPGQLMLERTSNVRRRHARARAALQSIALLLLLLVPAAPVGADGPTVSTLRTRGAGSVVRASDTNGCLERKLEVRVYESAQKIRPVAETSERRELRIMYSVSDLCTRISTAFLIEASQAMTFLIRPQLDQADLLVDAPSILVQRCQVRGRQAVCEAIFMPLHLHVHWTYNGLYDIHLGKRRSRDASGFFAETTNQTQHMASIEYTIDLNGESIEFAQVSGSMIWDTEAEITITSPAGIPVTTLP